MKKGREWKYVSNHRNNSIVYELFHKQLIKEKKKRIIELLID